MDPSHLGPSLMLAGLVGLSSCDTMDDSGTDAVDADADGFEGPDDCDDTDPSVHPGADESCNGVDDDCDGEVDEDDAVDAAAWYADADTDGYGDPAVQSVGCTPPEGYVADRRDCDDTDPFVHPGAEETAADGIDQDCDGGDACYVDEDTDGYGTGMVLASTDLDCTDTGESPLATDCDDGDGAVYPGADEHCNGVDDDCDGLVDDEDDSLVGAPTWYADADGDEYGDQAVRSVGCAPPEGYVADGTDCDDGNPAVNPCAAEVCDDEVDDDCDGRLTCTPEVYDRDAEDADALWYEDDYGLSIYGNTHFFGPGDVDGDGYDDILIGAPGSPFSDSTSGAVYVVRGDACPLEGGLLHETADAVLWGEDEGDRAAYVVGAGDLDSDGLADVYVSAPGHNPAAIYVVPGSSLLADAPLADVAAARYTGVSGGMLGGVDLAGTGDVNGDGIGDLLVGDCTYSDGKVGEGESAGAAWLVLGSDPLEDRSLLDAIRLDGAEAGDWAGYSVAGAGDVDGDGLRDLLVGAPSWGDGDEIGSAYVVLGSPSPASGSLADADVELTGQAGDRAGVNVEGGGDVNGDGFHDLLVEAWKPWEGTSFTGAVYIVLGSASPASRSLADADGIILGADDSHLGESIAFLGDVDGDGLDEVATACSSYHGVYIFLGSSLPSHTSVADADAWIYRHGWGHIRIGGAGDVNGDGLDDVLVGWWDKHDWMDSAVALFQY